MLACIELTLLNETNTITKAKLYTVQGAAQLGMAKYEGAIADFQQAQSLDPNSYWASRLAALHAYPQMIDQLIEDGTPLDVLQELVAKKRQAEEKYRKQEIQYQISNMSSSK